MSDVTAPRENTGHPADTIAYLAEGGSLVPVRVDRVEEGKLVTYGIDNKERKVTARRLLWTSQALAANRHQQ